MANLKSIKTKILSYKKTGTVTHAMEAVSAVKMRKGQERALSGRAYAAAALSVLERLSGTADIGRYPLMRQGSGKTCFIIVTSDKGLAGPLNSGVIRCVEREIAEQGLSKDDVIMIAVGRRGGDYFTNRGYAVRHKYENVSDGISESEVRSITEMLIDWHTKGELAACAVVYQNFISTFEQEPSVRNIVPVTPTMLKEFVAG